VSPYFHPGEKDVLKADLLRQLIGAGALCPTSVPVDCIRNQWFATREAEAANGIIDDLVVDPNALVRLTKSGVRFTNIVEAWDLIVDLDDGYWPASH
jgi:hypothetical protein